MTHLKKKISHTEIYQVFFQKEVQPFHYIHGKYHLLMLMLVCKNVFIIYRKDYQVLVNKVYG